MQAMQEYRVQMDLEIDLEGDAVPGLINRIRELRKKAGLKQDQLAEKIGVDPATISRLEKGQVRITGEYLILLSDVLGCTPIELISDPGDVARTDVERRALTILRQLHPDVAASILTMAEQLPRKE